MIRTKDISRQVVGRFWVRWAQQKNVGATRHQHRVGQAFFGRCSQSGAAGKKNGSWHNESQYKEELEPLRMGDDLRLAGSLMRQEFKVGKAGDWA